MKWYNKLAVLGIIPLALGLYSCDKPINDLEREPQDSRQVRTSQREEQIETSISKANQWLREFPEEVPGAREVEKYETPGARYSLAHIRVMHSRPFGYKIPSKEEILSGRVKLRKEGKIIDREDAVDLIKNSYSLVNRSQKNTYKILSFLNLGYSVTDVRMEGVFEEDDLEELNKNIRYLYNKDLDKLRKSGYFNPERMDNYMWIPGAAELMAMQGKIKLLPAESEEYERGERYNEEGREDTLLETVSGQDKPYAVTVYGRGHNWKDNIERWNEEHPDKQFSLVEVYPYLTRTDNKSSGEKGE